MSQRTKQPRTIIILLSTIWINGNIHIIIKTNLWDIYVWRNKRTDVFALNSYRRSSRQENNKLFYLEETIRVNDTIVHFPNITLNWIRRFGLNRSRKPCTATPIYKRISLKVISLRQLVANQINRQTNEIRKFSCSE